MDDRSEVDRILGEWYQRRLDGTAGDRDALLREHPELADELRVALDALDLLEPGTTDAEPATPSGPEQIGDYRIVREIGRGGMGVVYEAEQLSMRRTVALKVLTPTLTGTGRAVKRFRREAQAAGQLHHTNIVPVFGMGQEQGYWFYAMELVEGRSLSDLIGDLGRQPRRERPSAGLDALGWAHGSGERSARRNTPASVDDEYFRRIAEVFAGVAEALQVAHEQGIVHRDIKPSNLLLDRDGTLKIVDFGLAHLDEPGPSMTLTGDLVGTPAYMSPEQAMAKRVEVDHRTDVYSLGATLYEALTLRPPFDGDTLQALCSQIITKDPALPRKIEEHIPKDLETIVLKAMEKDRDRRYQRAADLATDLRHFALGAVIAARRVGLVERAWRKVKRHKTVASLAAGLLIVSAIGIVLGLQSASHAAERQLLAYQQRVAKAEAAFADPEQSETGIDLLDEAIALAPERIEAYVVRALAPGRSRSERLQDIADAERNGLPTRTGSLLRQILGATDLPPGVDPHEIEPTTALEAYAAAGIALRGSGADRFERAVALLDRAVADSPAGSILHRLALEKRSVLHQVRRDFDRALADLETLRGLGDRRVGLEFRIADLWVKAGKEHFGEAMFEDLLDSIRKQETGAAWYTVFKALQDIRRLEWLERAGAAARAQYPESAELALRLAQALANQARRLPSVGYGSGPWPVVRGREAARAAFETAERLDPDSAAAWDGHLALLACFEKWPAVVDVAKRRLRLDPEHEWTLCCLANALIDLDEWAEIPQIAERALATDTERRRAWWHMVTGVALLRTQGAAAAESALTEFDAAREHFGEDDGLTEPQRSFVRCQRAVALGMLGRHTEALVVGREAVTAAPNDPRAHATLVAALRSVNDHDGVLAELVRRREVAPEDPDAWNNLAWFWVGNESPTEYHDAEKGLEAARRAVELADPPEPHVLDTLAHALFLNGQHEEAAATERRALAVLDARGESSDTRREQYVDALERFTRGATTVDPETTTASADLVREALRLAGEGQREAAEQRAREALAMDDDCADAQAMLAELLLDRGQPAAALPFARRAAELAPRSDDAHRVLVRALRVCGEQADLECEIERFVDWQIADAPPERIGTVLAGIASRATRAWDRPTALAANRKMVELRPGHHWPCFSLAVALRHAGYYREAVAHYERGTELFRSSPERFSTLGEGHPSETWLRELELLAAQEPGLTMICDGLATPTDAEECLQAAWHAYRRQRFVRAVELRKAAAEFDPGANDRYQLACAAALGGFGLGFDAESPDVRAELRATARTILQALLAEQRARLAGGTPKEQAKARGQLRHWINDYDLRCTRDPDRLARIPAEERAAWAALWTEVRAGAG